ncbi:D-amino acid dehydrogenase [Litchfieldella qijiaojingensis]|uniref:D-amino acid dehydrogenase n=1 Tax=Litchfieldella qijiaojingensis TaxID=980347 RepID=A0ABQ2Z3H9_9GAMM|nr:D-amino acid dehydrogenase [Halomonas qijiaojingensis]GGY01466.1 D-amino acid dehydrogenase [Halomonas qijiaojingensis]
MHIAVIGAGVVGVTTAYALCQRGHQVTVIERLDAAGMETSRANAGQRSYGYVYPWASPAMIKKALPWLLQQDAPLKMHLPPTADTLRFLIATWRFAQTPGLFDANKRAMLRLGSYSRQCFQALEDELSLDFDSGHRGLMELASDAQSAKALQVNAGLLNELGIEYESLDAAATLEREPALAEHGPLVGSLWLPGDGTGDCYRFTQALARTCEARGVCFQYGAQVVGAERDKGHIRALRLKPSDDGADVPECIASDAFVLCAGTQSRRLGELFGAKLPIYPVKGYSLTAPLLDPERAPRSTVIDDRYKVVSTRLGSRLRATGFVELADMDRRIPGSRLATIRRAIESRFPGAADLDAAESWTGFRPMTPDGPPVIGEGKRNNLYLNTGHGTFGWTLSAGSAQLVAQLIDGETPAVSLEPFRPGRFAH